MAVLTPKQARFVEEYLLRRQCKQIAWGACKYPAECRQSARVNMPHVPASYDTVNRWRGHSRVFGQFVGRNSSLCQYLGHPPANRHTVNLTVVAELDNTSRWGYYSVHSYRSPDK